MQPHDAEYWNDRYQAEEDIWLRRNPNPLLEEYVSLLPTYGLALDAAAGVGINSRFLAQRGLRVISLDISEVALRHAYQLAQKQKLPIRAVVFDLSNLWLPSDCLDLIVNFRFLDRTTFPIYRRALKPGGLLFLEILVRISVVETNPHHYLKPGELISSFQDFDIKHRRVRPLDKDYDGPQKWAEQLIARKPIVP